MNIAESISRANDLMNAWQLDFEECTRELQSERKSLIQLKQIMLKKAEEEKTKQLEGQRLHQTEIEQLKKAMADVQVRADRERKAHTQAQQKVSQLESQLGRLQTELQVACFHQAKEF